MADDDSTNKEIEWQPLAPGARFDSNNPAKIGKRAKLSAGGMYLVEADLGSFTVGGEDSHLAEWTCPDDENQYYIQRKKRV